MERINKLGAAVFLIVSDMAALFVSFIAAYFLRSSLLLSIIPRFREQESLSLGVQLKSGFAAGAIIIIVVLMYGKLYMRRMAFWEEVRSLIQSVSIAYTLILILVFVSRQYLFFSRATIVMAWLISLFVFPFFRLISKHLLITMGLWKRKVLILGVNDTSRLISLGIADNRTLGYEVVGFLAEREGKNDETFAGRPVLGKIDDVQEVSSRLGIRDIIVALPTLSQNELIKVIESCDEFAESIRIVPTIGSLFTLGVRIENFGDVLSLNLNRNLIKPWNTAIKYVFEYLLILLLLVLLLPLFLITALVIKLDSRGPVFFVQNRLGKKGKEFKIIKFRSMFVDCEAKLEAYLEQHPEVKKEWDRFQKIKGFDPRVTRVGKFIRRYSLDEIPQLINVLKGEMSLVGPRPYLPRESDILDKSYGFISRIKPGLTGLWQVRGRNLLPFKQRILLDEYYIRNWSLWLDIVILLKTPRILARKEGAF